MGEIQIRISYARKEDYPEETGTGMITKKAAVGFILLAAIVFVTAYLSWTPDMAGSTIAINSSDIDPGLHDTDHLGNTAAKVEYHKSDLSFDTPIAIGVAASLVIEIFTLFCYLILKRIEPGITAWEQSERERISALDKNRGNP